MIDLRAVFDIVATHAQGNVSLDQFIGKNFAFAKGRVQHQNAVDNSTNGLEICDSIREQITCICLDDNTTIVDFNTPSIAREIFKHCRACGTAVNTKRKKQ